MVTVRALSGAGGARPLAREPESVSPEYTQLRAMARQHAERAKLRAGRRARRLASPGEPQTDLGTLSGELIGVVKETMQP